MFRTIPTLIFAASALLITPAHAEDDALGFVTTYRDAVQAFRENDNGVLVQSAQAVLEQVPDLATARYLYAVGRARQGWLGDAATALQQLADQGLTTRLEAIPAFAPLLEETRYAALRQQLLNNRQVLGTARVVHQLELPQFVPEGLARAPDGTLLLGSVHQARIVRIHDDGTTSDWAKRGDHGLCSVLGMRFDAAGEHLYVATACMQQTAGIDSQRRGRSGIFVYDQHGRWLAAHWLPADNAEHVLGDVLPWDEHTVITSDSLTGAILSLDPASGVFSPLIAAGRLPNPQGLVADARAEGLYIADYQAGIFYFHQETQTLQRLSNPARVATHGIDGLVRCNRTLVGIQNGVRPNRIVALTLDPAAQAITAGTVLARGLAEWDEPTLGIVDNQRLLYVANSHWPQFNEHGELPTEELDGPQIMALPIPGCGDADLTPP